MKLILTTHEKLLLKEGGYITIFRTNGFSCPISSIIHGTGTYHLWDKVDRRWVFGDSIGYISAMMNKGLRAMDYPDNTRSKVTGQHWYEYENQDQNDIGQPGDLLSSGWLNKISFTISSIHISELKTKGAFKEPVFSISLTLAKLKL